MSCLGTCVTHREGGRGGILWDPKRFEGRCGQDGVTSGVDLGDELKLFCLTDIHIHGYLLLCPPPLTLHGLLSDRSCEFGRRRVEGGGREKRGKKKRKGKKTRGAEKEGSKEEEKHWSKGGRKKERGKGEKMESKEEG